MKDITEYKPIIIGVDHGYGNIKTEHCVFCSGVERTSTSLASDRTLVYDNETYIIGEKHMTYQGDKTGDQSFYILTLAAIAEELNYRGYSPTANIILAVGLPLAWTAAQRKDFREYLRKNEEPEFEYMNTRYHLHIEKVKIYAQGLAESCLLDSHDGDHMIADIGNGTMNVVRFSDGSPIEKSIATEKYGVGTCIKNIRDELSRLLGRDIEERIIDRLIREGCNEKTDDIASVTARLAGEYAQEIIKKLADLGYVEGYVQLHIFGGGGCLLKNYSDLSARKGVHFNDDICANAKSYAIWAAGV